MHWLTAAQIPIIVLALWLFTAYMARSFPTLHNKRICLLIAHPDDEAMFFAPALLELTRPELGNTVVILCLSSGDADGLGHVRKDELKKSALHLGLRSAEHVVVLEDENFQDSMTKTWDAKAISATLTKYFAPNVAKTPSTTAPQTSIEVLITFDDRGVSGHLNHISLLHGARAFVKSVMQRHAGWECPVKLYTLTTTNVVRKYSTVLDSLATILMAVWRKKEKAPFPTPLIFVSTPGNVLKAQSAMTTAHKSQMVWFRWLYISISRYMIVNDLVKQKV